MEEDSDGSGGCAGSCDTGVMEGGFEDWDTLGSVEVRGGGVDDGATLGGRSEVGDVGATLRGRTVGREDVVEGVVEGKISLRLRMSANLLRPL